MLVTYLNSGLVELAVTLTEPDSGAGPMITTTNGTGYYKFTNVEVGEYYLNFTKLRYVDNSTELTVQLGETKEVNVSPQIPEVV